MNEGLIIDDAEDYAFYQSGLSADGCLEKMDDYTRKAIKRYGEILLEKQKEDFIKGFKGCCYCCELVGELNQRLEKLVEQRIKDAEEFFRENREAILSAISVKPIEMMTALCDNPYSLCKEISGIVPMNGYPKGQVFYRNYVSEESNDQK